MAIYLVQHGLALAKDVDVERGLSEEGIRKVQMIADVARHYAIQLKSIVHSGKKRARQTAEILAATINPMATIAERDGLDPMADVAVVAAELDEQSHQMLVGHLPFMEKLVSQLITGTQEYCPFKFQNGGIVCLDREEGDEKWFVKWALMPDIA